MKQFIAAILGSLLVFSCGKTQKKIEDYPSYDGPAMEVDSSTILYSDSAVVRVKIDAVKQYDFENGDKEFPEGIFIEFYEPNGELSSTLEAQKAFYTKETDLYKAVGDVVVVGYIEPQKLNTEELFWNPKAEEIYTEKFVRIETKDQISTGTGLTAKQDFSSYRILNPKGTLYMDEENEVDDSQEKNKVNTSKQKNENKTKKPKRGPIAPTKK